MLNLPSDLDDRESLVSSYESWEHNDFGSESNFTHATNKEQNDALTKKKLK